MFLLNIFNKMLDGLENSQHREVQRYLANSTSLYEVEDKIRRLERNRSFSSF